MPVVPVYNNRTVQLAPNNQGELRTRASPDAFGAQVGQALEGVGRAVGGVARQAMSLQALEDETRAKEADNAFSDAARGFAYDPDKGFFNTQGRNAVDGRGAFDTGLEDLRKKHAEGLTGGAAKMYEDVSKRRVAQYQETAINHVGREKKAWIKTASDSRLETFQNDALASYGDPKKVEQSVASGLAELQQRAAIDGWDNDTLKNQSLEYSSKVRRGVIMRMAEDDPLAADAYFQKHKDRLTGQDQYNVGKSLEEGVATAGGQADAKRIWDGKRSGSVEPEPQGNPIQAPVKSRAGALPASTRDFLLSRTPGKAASHIDGLDTSFAQNVAAMIQDAPPGVREGLQIMSGHRSVERQTELWRGALAKYGSAAAARKWVAPPGKSNHNHGKAADLMWNGQRLDKAPKQVRDWVHANASSYNLYFRMGNEPWHIEPEKGGAVSQVVARRDGAGVAAQRPSYDDMQAELDKIADPKRRAVAERYLNAQMTNQANQAKAAEKQAELQLFSVVEQGGTPDDVPIDVRLMAGQSSLSSAWSYYEAKQKRANADPETDQELLYGMRRMGATEPDKFKDVNLLEYRDRLSKSDFKELMTVQESALKEGAKPDNMAKAYADAYKQADILLDAAGLTTTGLDGEKNRDARAEMSGKIARFQNSLKDQIDLYKEKNSAMPGYDETQAMIAQLLVPVVTSKPGSMFGTTEGSDLMFNIPALPNGVTFDVQYQDIPPEFRSGIERDIELRLGRKPTPEEVQDYYEHVVLGKAVQLPDTSLPDVPVNQKPDFSLPDVPLGRDPNSGFWPPVEPNEFLK